jgi:DNA-binding transcriptional LysR family regulator
MDLNEVSYFVAVVEHGGFSRAAAALSIPKSTLSRKVSDLEARLGVTLLTRTTRKQTLTHAGEEYYRQCFRLLSEMKEAEKSITQSQKNPQGLIRFSAPADSGPVLAPLLKEFSKRYPLISLEVILTDRLVDLVAERFDIAFRAGALRDLSLKAKKIGVGGFKLYASPQYLKTKGAPKSAPDLLRHDCIVFQPDSRPSAWKLTNGKERWEIKVSDRLRTNSLDLAKRMAEISVGIVALPKFVSHDCLQNGALVPVLPDLWFLRTPFSLIYPEQKHMPPRLRLFVDFMSEGLSKIDW